MSFLVLVLGFACGGTSKAFHFFVSFIFPV